ncbi:hypothetical protein MPNT_170002 [Candidatus Methylacidithermus pantelleriae]|uniref:Uncharacterized protein n=1 Tax=Candidatus Methylacidithermus pantelleriae TaxID=2744239 RepID=A0A8J2BMZ8_9BACT|nr:hypothetical protein MPNT_170002 [Candidatus Methylacidithermus pantelleriae]
MRACVSLNEGNRSVLLPFGLAAREFQALRVGA